MRRASPFSVNRFEYEAEHIYFLQTESFNKLQGESPKPIYLIGPRGTGKTTLLKALDWHERLVSRSLREQLSDGPFDSPAGPFIGVYLKLPEFQLNLIERWLVHRPAEEAGSVLAFYLDLLWIQQVGEAISRLSVEGQLATRVEAEHGAVSRIVDAFPATLSGRWGRPRTLLELVARIVSLRQDLLESARNSLDSVVYLANQDGIQQPGNFGRLIGAELADLCATASSSARDRWHFKVCMDEGECLTSLQQKTLNSIARLARWPVFLVAAFVSPPRDMNSTLINNLTLQDADCEIVDLSEFITPRRFKELAEGVATARVRHVLGDQSAVRVNNLLGTFGVNGLLRRILTGSVAPEAKRLLEKARVLGGDPFFQDVDVKDAIADDGDNLVDEDDEFPIYQAYLIERLRIELPKPSEPTWRRRRQSSAELRKRMVAAYLSICADLGIEVRYASGEVVLALCDLCIRDFLDFIHGIHHQTGLSVADFVARQVGWAEQHEALRAVSRAKSSSIRTRGVRAPREAEAVVRGLAHITHILQTQSRTGEHLRSSERGIFVLAVDQFYSENDTTARIIRDACEAGFLRLWHADEKVVSVRVHASLAPEFQFSYRGAYYRAPVSWADIELLRRSQREDLEVVVNKITNRLAGEENLSLFEGQ